MKKVVVTLATFALFAATGGTVFATHNPLHGKIIALDAGHGAADTGATGYCGGVAVREVEVNLAVRSELAALLTNAGATAHLVEQLASRKARVADAESAGSAVLISIHHNGATNTSTDYTRSYVTQKNDKDFAAYIHPRLASAFGPDKGIKSDGYGMTVYGSLPGVLTEPYFITNTNASCDFLKYLSDPTDPSTRVQKEAQAMFSGLSAYFLR